MTDADVVKDAAEGFKLDIDIKRNWVNALRSGDYKQGVGMLCNGNNYCCLGVYAEISPLFKKEFGNRDTVYIHNSGYVCKLTLTEYDIPPRVQSELATLNDNGRSFDEIANIIEEVM